MQWNRFDTRWTLSLFGTAVGAGILFLPIRAGTGGFYPVVLMSFLIFPMVWLSHRALSRFVNESKNTEHDITHAAEEYWGRGISFFITLLYFFAIYPICLAYGVGITNTFASFFIHQLNLISLYDPNTMTLYPLARAGLAFVLVSAMMAIMVFKVETITKACNALVYPLCAVLFAFSLYLIPYWKLESLQKIPSFEELIQVVWLTLPVLVFAFNHSPAISTFTLNVRKTYHNSQEKANQILFRTAIFIACFCDVLCLFLYFVSQCAGFRPSKGGKYSNSFLFCKSIPHAHYCFRRTTCGIFGDC